jgi:hypothetical protein
VADCVVLAIEGISHRSQGWPALVVAHLADVVNRQVITSLFESRTGDEGFDAHPR